MRKHASTIAAGALVLTVVLAWESRQAPVQGQAQSEPRFAAVPGEKGGQDTFGAYDIVPDWQLPVLVGHVGRFPGGLLGRARTER